MNDNVNKNDFEALLKMGYDALKNGDFKSATVAFDYCINHSPSAQAYIGIMLCNRQNVDVQELIDTGIPINMDAHFLNALNMALDNEKDDLKLLADRVLLSCHMKFLTYAFEKNELYMKAWSSHYNKFCDNELSKFQDYIIKNGGIDTEKVLLPGACLKLCEIYDMLSNSNPEMTEDYKVAKKSILQKFADYMEMTKAFILSQNTLSNKKLKSKYTNIAISFDNINDVFMKTFNISEKEIANYIEQKELLKSSQNKTLFDVTASESTPKMFMDVDLFKNYVEGYRKHISKLGMIVRTPEEIKQIEKTNAYIKRLRENNKTVITVNDVFDIITNDVESKYTKRELPEMIEIWVNPIGSFYSKTGITIIDVSFDDQYPQKPAERYIAVAKMLIDSITELKKENSSIIKLCFEKAYALEGNKYKPIIRDTIKSFKDYDESDVDKMALYLNLNTIDEELQWKYVLAFTNNFTKLGDTYEITENLVTCVTSNEKYEKAIKDLETKLSVAKQFPTITIKRLEPHVNYVLENTEQNKIISKQQWDNYLVEIENHKEATIDAINRQICAINVAYKKPSNVIKRMFKKGK